MYCGYPIMVVPFRQQTLVVSAGNPRGLTDDSRMLVNILGLLAFHLVHAPLFYVPT